MATSEVIIDKRNQQEVEDVLAFIMGLDEQERSDFAQFVQGVNFGIQIAAGRLSSHETA